MSDRYWDKAWSLIDSCTPISEGCENCWSAALDFRFAKGNARYCNTENKTFFYKPIRIRKDRLDIPLRTKKPTTFAIWNDLFHENVDFEFSLRAFIKMRKTPQHTYLILTKRPQRMLEFIAYWGLMPDPLTGFTGSGEYITENIYFGTSCETQQRLKERIPYLFQIPGKRFLSIEPLLSPVNLTGFNLINGYYGSFWIRDISWVVVGAETGNPHRPCKLSWIESIVQQCKDAEVPCFVKAININGKVIRDIEKFPKHLKVRDLPWQK